MNPFLRRASSAFEQKLGHRFKRPELLALAITHRSYANEEGLDSHYERLEFLGDAVLGLVAAEWLYLRHPTRPEGELSRLKSGLVSARSLARLARELGLGRELRLGVGEARSGGREKRSLLADSLEAVFGAVYQDGGMEAARKVIVPLLEELAQEHEGGLEDAKTALQEVIQARGWELPEYRLAEEIGPDHEKVFRVECLVRGVVAGSGEGRSKKVAEQVAAAAALVQLDPSGAAP